jgi:hypothetical protein
LSKLHPGNDHRRALLPLTEQDQDSGGWDDQQVSVEFATGVSALTLDSYRDTPAQIRCMRHDQNDAITVYTQLPHRWDKGEVRPHIHIVPLADPVAAQNIYFSGQYTWSTRNSVIPENALWTAFDVTVIVNPGNVYIEKKIALLQLVPPIDIVESNILIVHLIRSGTNVLDTYTTNKDHGTLAANVGIISIDTHFKTEKSGTYEEFPSGA